MYNTKNSSDSLYGRNVIAVLVAQFFSALSDNALLFATLALIKHHTYPEWSYSILQMLFVFAYILLAPFVGQFADFLPKSRVMMIGNGVKLFGSLFILFQIEPFLGYTLVGLGAAIYSPAKYGILSELVSEQKLIKANGLVEASTIIAILLGSLLSGYLSDISIGWAIMLSIIGYIIALNANRFIPSIVPSISTKFNLIQCVKQFILSCLVLCKNHNSYISLLGTSLFWGAGVTLRFLLVLWVPFALKINDNFTPTLLNAVVAIGIIIGAAVASSCITLTHYTRCLPAAIAMGIVVLIFTNQSNLILTYALLIIIGALGGFFIVPLNALLQDIGKRTVGAGKAIAIQNLGENSAMLIMLGLYTYAVHMDISALTIGSGFGIMIVIFYSLLYLKVMRLKASD